MRNCPETSVLAFSRGRLATNLPLLLRRLLQMATFSSGVQCFRCFFMRSLDYLNGGTLLHFQLNRNNSASGGNLRQACRELAAIIRNEERGEQGARPREMN
jgi:hypothetical protein